MKIKLRSVGDWLLRDFLAPERDLYATSCIFGAPIRETSKIWELRKRQLLEG
jgi:hypothetical protein